MRIVFLSVALVGLAVASAQAQIVRPDLTPPPCSGHGCLAHARGATTPPPEAAAQRRACPPGTVLNPRKGTCKVMPSEN